mmetsp:Transcript_40471/g.160604  ORF Transcript_40471/g.160604 Transcript_40471/m.160604 type:complete len:85 (-) Transcript_40471:43-297(-)
MEKLHSESPSSDMLSTLLRRNALSGLVPEFPAGEIEEDWLEPQSAADERLERFRELVRRLEIFEKVEMNSSSLGVISTRVHDMH